MNRDAVAQPGNALYTLLVNVSFVLVFAAVLLSAYLRLERSGLGCVDWPACYGLGALADMPPEAKTWADYVHRLVATLLGVFVVGIALIALRNRKDPAQPLLIPLALLAITVFLSVLGYATPSPHLPAVTLANLLGGMGMLGMLWWLSLRPGTIAAPRGHARAWRIMAWVGVVLVLAQIALGAWVSGNFAAAACPGLPGCGATSVTDTAWRESFSPRRELAVDAAGQVRIGDDAPRIHMLHRVGALVVLFGLAALGFRALRRGAPDRTIGVVLLCLVLLQLIVGAAMVSLALPIVLVTVHNALAALLLLTTLRLAYVARHGFR